MSWKACEWAAKCRVGNPTRKLVLLALAENANPDGYSPVGTGYLVRVAECSEKSVRRHLQALESMGLLVRTRRRKKDGMLGGYDMWLQLQQRDFWVEEDAPEDNLATGQNGRWTLDEGTEGPLEPDTVTAGDGHSDRSFPGVSPRCSSPGESPRAPAREAPTDERRQITWRNYRLDITAAPPDLSEAALIEWLDWRRHERRAPCNQSVVTRACRELAQCVADGWSADEALAAAMGAGWTEPNAQWLRNRFAERSAGQGGADSAQPDADAAFARLKQHCSQGHNIGQVEADDPTLAKAARDLGGMSHLRGLSEREFEFQRRKFQSLYRAAAQPSAAVEA